ncbi:unnamed protein product [Brassicogethes aeneus]|uniref:CCHC-type domain-containing protein n=1 Tax=Brassicogethes aeneus TaxID=1431903 RepID=A0A9P0FBX8_BRAAE|nr:unnamed protein product [Brassicogethes aeneus]
MEEATGSKLTVQGVGSPVPAAKSDRAGSKSSSSSGCNDAGFRLAPTSESATSKSSKDNHIATEKDVNVTRFLVIKRTDEENFFKLLGEVKSIKKIRDGILVETKSNKQSIKLLNLVRFGEYDVKVLKHNTFNTSKGIIYCPDLLNCELKEIENSLEDQGVLNVKRITTKKKERIVDTPNHILTFPNHILTFNTLVMLKNVNVAFYRLEVRPYIPNPLRCFKCHKFGHVSDKCKSEEVICVCERRKKSLVKVNLQHSQKHFKAAQSQNNANHTIVKQIVKELLPEIANICRAIIIEEKSFVKPKTVSTSRDRSVTTKSLEVLLDPAQLMSQSSHNSRSRTISESSSKKRLRTKDDNDSDNSQYSYLERYVIKKIKDGLLVEAKNDKQAKRLQSLVRFGEVDVAVKTHQTLNYSKGVIYCNDLLNCSVEELKEHLLVEGITDFKRIQTKKDGKLIDTPTHIITFNSPVLPKKINAAFHRLEVRPYIPNPLRCFKCQKFGHTTDKCESKVQICTCGQPPHEGTPCTLPIKCVNCSGDHPARSRSCPVYPEEAAIQKIKTLDKVTYFAAKRRHNMSKNINPPKSFSDVVKTTAPAASNLKIENIVKALIPEITKVVISIMN